MPNKIPTLSSAVNNENAGANAPLLGVTKQPGSLADSDTAYDKEWPPLGFVSKGKRRNNSVQNETPLKANYAGQQDDHSPPTSFGKKQHAKYSYRSPEVHWTSPPCPVVRRNSDSCVGLQEAEPFESNYTRQQDDNFLPTSFGKKQHAKDFTRSSLPTSSEKKQHAKYSNRSPELRRTSPPYSGVRRNSDCGEGLQVAEPFDICLPQRRKSFVHKTLWHEKNKDVQIEMENSVEEETDRVLRSGMVLLKGYITLNEQVQIVKKCRELGLGPGGFYRPGYQDGAKLRLQMMCLGMNWDPQMKYEEKYRSDGSEPPGIPEEFVLLVEKALQDSHVLIKDFGASNVEETLPMMTPNICIVNFYTNNGRLGLHKDCDESIESLDKGLPVVSVSVGDSAEFLYGDERDVNKATPVFLESGDVVIFGGQSRHIFHGVSYIVPNSAPPALLEKARLRPGRLNLTFRQF